MTYSLGVNKHQYTNFLKARSQICYHLSTAENEIRDGILSLQTTNLLLNERKSLSGNAWPAVVTVVQTIQGQYGSSNRGR